VKAESCKRQVVIERPNFLLRAITAFAIGFVGYVPLAQAEEWSKRLSGHEIRIQKSDDPKAVTENSEILTLDGRLVLKDDGAGIDIEQTLLVDGTQTVLGSINYGGNACEGTTFVFSVSPKSRSPLRLAKIPTCYVVTTRIEAKAIHFSTSAVPGTDGENWLWSPQRGLVRLPPTKWMSDPKKTWDTIEAAHVTHPADLMDFAPIASRIYSIVGPSRKRRFNAIVTGTGEAKTVGHLVIATSCVWHLCDLTGLLLVADTQAHQIYMAWKDERHPLVVKPTTGWPQEAKAELDEMRNRFAK
jgi:hypothetical protein